MVQPTIPALAAEIARRFPELGGRSIAVSEVDPFADQSNTSQLPIAVVSLGREDGQQGKHGGAITLTDNIVVHFIYEPSKYKNKEFNDTPFFSFYNYQPIRDELLSMIKAWSTPEGGVLTYQSMSVSSDEGAVYMTFNFATTFKWCDPAEADPAFVVDGVVKRIVQPTSKCCEPEETATDPCDVPSAHE